jgi:hypothetical protein
VSFTISEKQAGKPLAQAITAALLLGALIAPSALAEGVKSYQVPAVIKKLTEKYGGPGLSQRSSTPVVTQADPLGHLVALQRQHWAQAWVTSTFYDYRTVSQYRRNPGLHLGYDIALPYGCSVSAGWEGTVTDIIPWTDTEYGVTVTDPSGLSVTYGHITPLVSIGQRVRAGSVIARIASDHVDVKMRDSAGQYVPFGEGSKANSMALASAAPVVDRKALLTAWLVAKTSADQADEELFMKENASQKLAIEKRSAERRVAVLENSVKELSLPENSALVSRKKLEEMKAELSQARATLKKVQSQNQLSTAQLKKQAQTNRANLKAFESWAKSEGLRWKDVEQLVAATVSTDVSLSKNVQKAKKETIAARSLTLAELEAKRSEGRKQLAELEELFAAGGMSLQEITDERLRQELIEEEYALKKSRSK